jgi:hypothetical protein
MSADEKSRSLERDEVRNLRVCYECRNVFLPEVQGDRGWDCPICIKGGA